MRVIFENVNRSQSGLHRPPEVDSDLKGVHVDEKKKLGLREI